MPHELGEKRRGLEGRRGEFESPAAAFSSGRAVMITQTNAVHLELS